jgi:hypothetical protein
MAGYYGTELLINKKLVWPSSLEIIFGRKYLDLPVEGLNDRKIWNYEVGDVVREVQLFGKFYTVGAYAKTLKALEQIAQQHPNAKVDTIPWDWRKDPREGALAIESKLNQMQLGSKDQVFVIAHSYGGLALSYYLRYGIQDYAQAKENWHGLSRIQKSVMVAVPFKGSLAVFKNMFQGQSRAGNKTILGPRAFSSFPSSYFMLPPQGQAFIFDEHGTLLELDFSNAGDWEKHRWGFFSSANNVQTNARLKEFKQMQLNQAKLFYNLTHQPASLTPATSTLYIQGGDQPTFERGYWARHKKAKQSCYFEIRDLKKYAPKLNPRACFVDGDGTISTSSSEPLEWFHHKTKFGLEHLKVLEAPMTMQLIADYLKSVDALEPKLKTFVSQSPASP